MLLQAGRASFNSNTAGRAKDLSNPSALKQDGLLAFLWDCKHLGFHAARGWMVTVSGRCACESVLGSTQAFLGTWENELKPRDPASLFSSANPLKNKLTGKLVRLAQDVAMPPSMGLQPLSRAPPTL